MTQKNVSDKKPSKKSKHHHDVDHNRRDFVTVSATAFGCMGLGAALWPLVDSMNPAADTMSMASLEIDLKSIPVGASSTVMFMGKPIFIRHRTKEEIEKAKAVDLATLPHNEKDESRTEKPEWLIVVGVCTHLGCVPSGQKTSDNKGEFGGWFCPCHGSEYDTSGRIRKGPAPKNLIVPEYTFVNDHTIRITGIEKRRG